MICSRCKHFIEEARLKILPNTAICGKCAHSQEGEAKAKQEAELIQGVKILAQKVQAELPLCPRCRKSLAVRQNSIKRTLFLGCSGYPQCNFTAKVHGDRECPQCGDRLVPRDGRFGPFFGCKGYPKCTWSEPAVTDKYPAIFD